MSTLIGRFLNATKNADGTVTLEFGMGTPTSSQGLTVITLTTSDVTALSAVLSGSTGTKSQAIHGNEKAPIGYEH